MVLLIKCVKKGLTGTRRDYQSGYRQFHIIVLLTIHWGAGENIMQNWNNGQKGAGMIKLLVKMVMLTLVVMLVMIAVPKVIQSIGYSQGKGFISDLKDMIGTISTSKVAGGDIVVESNNNDDLPVYKQVINYFPDYSTSSNVYSIVKAINVYKISNNGKLPQSDEELESCLSKPIAALGPAGAVYSITYFPSVVIITATSPTSAIYSVEVEEGAEY
jgi:hypothetical protein